MAVRTTSGPPETIRWRGGHIQIIDQTRLPEKLHYVSINNVKSLWHAIRTMQVRGAPAIGIAAALGMYLGVRGSAAKSARSFLREVERVARFLATARPTAINLFWALERMKRLVKDNLDKSPPALKRLLLAHALEMIDEDNRVCKAMGDFGARLLRDGDTVLTHCNAGGLATAGYGTALAVVYRAVEQGKRIHVFVDETRPLLQGARLTAWELKQSGIPATLMCDNMAASVMAKGWIKAVLVGADRITANGDFANKIGTYNLAVLAKYHRVPFYVVAPLSSFDPRLTSGDQIPIEERPPEELIYIRGQQIAPAGIMVHNPAFDVTPARFVTAVVTEGGILKPPFASSIRKVFRLAEKTLCSARGNKNR
jgi:methylthioribose-1-phosphate isomerase